MRYLLVCLVLSGCANGVAMNDDERIACRNYGCVVMTEDELVEFGAKVDLEAYKRGLSDAVKQGARGI